MFLNNFKLTASNMTYAYMLLKQLFSDQLTETQRMFGAGVIQCANFLNSSFYKRSHFDLAFVRAQSGECGLDMYTQKIYKKPWYERPPQTPIETFCNYVMNVECLFFDETMQPRIGYRAVVDAVVSRKNTIYKAVNKTLSSGNKKQTYTNYVVSTWVNAVMSFPEYSKWKSIIMTYEV